VTCHPREIRGLDTRILLVVFPIDVQGQNPGKEHVHMIIVQRSDEINCSTSSLKELIRRSKPEPSTLRSEVSV
jgi:hypothetical protein